MPNNPTSNIQHPTRDDNIAIKVSNLTKIYHLYDKPQDRLKEALNPFKKSYHHDFYAMNNVSFEIKKGETVGIIGKNGAGKSTLLKMITGVLTPTSGTIEVNGKIASLLELGAGFNPEMSGIENIYLNGTLMGFTKDEIDTKVDSILEFADIGEFINQPVKMYSSGMFARLAFSIAINVEPEVLIVDEALSVGDISFQAKCLRRMEKISQCGVTILFVSHDTQSISKFCKNVIWINDGVIIEKGDPSTIIENFLSFMTYGLQTERNQINEPQQNLQTTPLSKDMPMIDVSQCDSFGEKQAVITGILFLDQDSNPTNTLLQGETATIICDFTTHIDLHFASIGVMLKDHINNEILTFNSYMYDTRLDFTPKGASRRAKIKFKVPKIYPSGYTVTISLSEGTALNHIQQHWIHEATTINIQSQNNIDGCIVTLYPNEIEYTYDEI